MVKPSATMTASAGHSRRWKVRCPRVMAALALIQRMSTYGHSAIAPGRIRMRAPGLTGALCTRVTPNSENATAVTAPIAA